MLCGIMVDDREECSIDFSVMMLQLPFETGFEKLNITFARSVPEAYAAFQQDPAVQVLMCVPTNKSNMEFFRKALQSDKGCVVGLYPIPRVDWSELEAGRPVTQLQIPASSIGDDGGSGYRRLRAPYDFRTSFPDCFVLKRGREHDQWVDTVEMFDSTAKVGFVGCVKLRLQ